MPKTTTIATGPRVKTATEEFHQRLLDEHAQSGLSLSEFCRSRGAHYGRVRWWRNEIKRRDASHAGRSRAVEFLPVLAKAEPEPPRRVTAAATTYDVALAGGRRVLRVPAEFDPHAVAMLVRALEADPC